MLSDESTIEAISVSPSTCKSSPAVLQDVLNMPDAVRRELMHPPRAVCEGDLRNYLYVMRIVTITLAESARVSMFDAFPAEGGDLPETALITKHPSFQFGL
jgi:hypothetical protein